MHISTKSAGDKQKKRKGDNAGDIRREHEQKTSELYNGECVRAECVYKARDSGGKNDG